MKLDPDRLEWPGESESQHNRGRDCAAQDNVRPKHTMNLTQHLEYVIGLIERDEPPAKIKASLVAMTEEVSGYERAAAKAIQLAEKKSAIETLSAPETTARLIEILNAIQTLKDQLDSALKDSAGASSRIPKRTTEDKIEGILETVKSIQAHLQISVSTLPQTETLGSLLGLSQFDSGMVAPRQQIRPKRRPFQPD